MNSSAFFSATGKRILLMFLVCLSIALGVLSSIESPVPLSEAELHKMRCDSVSQVIATGKDSLRQAVCRLADEDSCRSETVLFLRNHYHGGGKLFLADSIAVSYIADSLLATIAKAHHHGLNPNAFSHQEAAQDLLRLRSFQFDSATNKPVLIAARLEYRLAKAFLDYSAGMRFGFVKPQEIFNNIDKRPSSEDPSGKRYRTLFHTDTEQADSAFFAIAIQQLCHDSLTTFLASVIPSDTLYPRLMKELALTDSLAHRAKIICNLERCRWRAASPLLRVGKHIVVNLPAQHLYAFGGDSLLQMRIVCGTKKNKTPLLKSQIERMEVNPLWRVPTNIIKNELAYHAGDSAYFAEDNYVITEKETGDTIDPKTTTVRMLRSGRYSITQRRGPGNSLGRIVFRFPNPFSVYLHDTSARGAFRREVRTLSHGCVRVEKPLDLAAYFLEGADEWTIDQVRISMGFKPESERGKKWMKEKKESLASQNDELEARGEAPIEAPKYFSLIKNKEIRPTVPLCITYFTLFFDHEGLLQSYPDRYGYDAILTEKLKAWSCQ